MPHYIRELHTTHTFVDSPFLFRTPVSFPGRQYCFALEEASRRHIQTPFQCCFVYRRHRVGPAPLFPTEDDSLREERSLRVRQPGQDHPNGSAAKASRDSTPEVERVLTATPTLNISDRTNTETTQRGRIGQSVEDWTLRWREGRSKDTEEPRTPLLRKRIVRYVWSIAVFRREGGQL